MPKYVRERQTGGFGMNALRWVARRVKPIVDHYSLIRPFKPESVDGQLWQEASGEQIACDARYFSFAPDELRHGFAWLRRGSTEIGWAL